jgi:hypothetical protein
MARTYVVQKGDTLSGIAKKFGLCSTPERCLEAAYFIQADNPELIKDVNLIQPGWTLKIPDSIGFAEEMVVVGKVPQSSGMNFGLLIPALLGLAAFFWWQSK